MALPMMGTSAGGAEQSRVVLIRDEGLLNMQGRINPEILEGMLDRAMCALFNTTEPLSAWKQLFGPEDIVGIKSNSWYLLPTPEKLEEFIVQRLRESGVREENMAVDDRGVLRNPLFKDASALVNVRPMRTHHWSGLGTLLKNYIMFVPRPSAYHGNACEKLGAIWHLPQIKGKTRLNILVMITPLFHGIGPHHFNRKYQWNYQGLILSRDPVAADATGAGIIQAKRKSFFKKQMPISPPPIHIMAADTRYGLGNSRPERINVVRLGWKEDILI